MKLETLDPRVKLLMLLVISTISVLARSLSMLLILLAVTLLLLFVGGADMKDAFGRLSGMIKLILTLFIVQCIFTRSGSPLLEVKGFTLITAGGFSMAALVTLRLFIILLSAVLILTGDSRDYLLALNQWHLPYEISFMVMAALRFVPILREEAQDVLCAVQMRGTKVKKTSLMNKMRVYTGILMPVVSGAIRRSEQMSVAMEARAFRARPTRTSMRRLVMKRGDWLYLAVFAVVIAAVVAVPLLLGWK